MEIFIYKSTKDGLAAYREWMGALGFTVNPETRTWVNEFNPHLSDPRPECRIVDVDRESPYEFGRLLRDAVGDEYTSVNLTNGFYWASGGDHSEIFAYCRSTIIHPLSLDMLQQRLQTIN
jgi:hypothetical protein